METKNIDRDNLVVTGAHMAVPDDDQHVVIKDDIIIIVTQAFGPKGDDLLEASTEEFDGYPGIPIRIRAAGFDGIVHVSPFHGDRRKRGMDTIPAGTKCELLCPVSGEPLPPAATKSEGSDTDYFAIYLSARLSDGEMVAISDVWGDYRSRIVDNYELISAWSVEEAS
jgi:hypothetical protein